MNILSNQFLYTSSSSPTPPPSYTYEAYYIHSGTMTSLGETTDLSKTFASQDEFAYSNMFVFNGDLYKDGSKVRTSGNITSLTGRSESGSGWGFFVEDGRCYNFGQGMGIDPVGSATDWIKVCGESDGSTYRGFGEASDGLWAIRSSASNVSTLTGWTKITGYSRTSGTSYYGYGIHNGALYYLYANGNGAVQQGSDTTWTDITGSYENGSWYGYGINAGKLYRLAGTPTQVGTDTTWTKISGTASSSSYVLGINGGKLYRISGTTAVQVGNSTDWKNCSGRGYSTTSYGLAYDSSALYGISAESSTKLMDGNWVYCGGNYSSNAYAVAIRRK